MVKREDTDAVSLDAAFGALADPTRRAIVDRLARAGDCSVGELGAPFAMSAPAVSKHLAVLERAGLVERRRVGRRVRCRLRPGPMDEVGRWLDERRRLWEARLDALATVLEEGT